MIDALWELPSRCVLRGKRNSIGIPPEHLEQCQYKCSFGKESAIIELWWPHKARIGAIVRSVATKFTLTQVFYKDASKYTMTRVNSRKINKYLHY